jgi:hypothetical protein
MQRSKKCSSDASGLGMRKLLTVISVILLIAGLVFVGQGSGYFPYPAESFMINQTPLGLLRCGYRGRWPAPRCRCAPLLEAAPVNVIYSSSTMSLQLKLIAVLIDILSITLMGSDDSEQGGCNFR